MLGAIKTYDRRIVTNAMRVGEKIAGLELVCCELCDRPALRWGRKDKTITLYAHIIDVTAGRGQMRTWCEFPDRCRREKPPTGEEAQAR